MTESQMITIIVTMFGLLIAVIGWIGVRAIHAIDQMRDKLGETTRELYACLNTLNHRVAIMETKYGKSSQTSE